MEQEIRRERVQQNNNTVEVALYRRSIDVLNRKGQVCDQRVVYWGNIVGMDEPMTLRAIMQLPLPSVDDTRQVYLRTASGEEYYINKQGVVFRKSQTGPQQEIVGDVFLDRTRIQLDKPAELLYKVHEMTAFGGFRTVEQAVSIGVVAAIRVSEEKA